MDLIIKEDDPRFSKLEYIYNTWNFNNIWIPGKGKAKCYVIPKELVINEYHSSSFDISPTKDEYCGKHLENILLLTCNINMEEYFNLLVLHNNDRDNYPKCANPICNNKLLFRGRISQGYYSHSWENVDYAKLFCSQSCSTYYMHHHLEEYPHMAYTESQLANVGNNGFKQAKSCYVRELTRRDNSYEMAMYFYVAILESEYKYGLTEWPSSRSSGLDSLSFRSYKLPLYKVALLEYLVKLRIYDLYECNSEYVNDSKWIKDSLRIFIPKIIQLNLDEFKIIHQKILDNKFTYKEF